MQSTSRWRKSTCQGREVGEKAKRGCVGGKRKLCTTSTGASQEIGHRGRSVKERAGRLEREGWKQISRTNAQDNLARTTGQGRVGVGTGNKVQSAGMGEGRGVQKSCGCPTTMPGGSLGRGRGGRPGAGTSVQQGRVSEWNLRRAKSGRRRGNSGLAGRKSPRGHRIPGQVGTEDAPDQRVWTRFPSHRARLKRFVPNAAADPGTGPRAGTTGDISPGCDFASGRAPPPPDPGKGAAPGPPPRQAQRGQSLPSSQSPQPGRPPPTVPGSPRQPQGSRAGKESWRLPPTGAPAGPRPRPRPSPSGLLRPLSREPGVRGLGAPRWGGGGWQQPGGANRWEPGSQRPAAKTQAKLPGRSAGASPVPRRDSLQLRAQPHLAPLPFGGASARSGSSTSQTSRHPRGSGARGAPSAPGGNEQSSLRGRRARPGAPSGSPGPASPGIRALPRHAPEPRRPFKGPGTRSFKAHSPREGHPRPLAPSATPSCGRPQARSQVQAQRFSASSITCFSRTINLAPKAPPGAGRAAASPGNRPAPPPQPAGPTLAQAVLHSNPKGFGASQFSVRQTLGEAFLTWP